MSEAAKVLKDWLTSFRDDVETAKKVVAAVEVDKSSRRFAAAALNYLVTRMDLVPDWEEGVGILDDAMVLRQCLALAADRGLDKLDAMTTAAAGRLGNDVEGIEALLGDLYGKFKAYCEKLPEQVVRGRTADTIATDAAARATLFVEVDEELSRLPPPKLPDPAQAERVLKSYLHAKLK